MNRDQLAHVIRAASDIADSDMVLVIGSQAVLATLSAEELPEAVTRSVEADIAFLDESDTEPLNSDRVDGAIGEGSQFHREFGYYGQGVAVETAVFPAGWRDRALAFTFGDTGAATAICPEIHDLVVAKLVAGRSKDFEFAQALVDAEIVDLNTLDDLATSIDAPGAVKRRIQTWISRGQASSARQ